MKQIPLRNGGVAVVDDEDFEIVRQYKWRAFKPRNVTYAVTQLPRRGSDRRDRTVRMHNVVRGDLLIDHINGDGLDNRRSNLRVATTAQNVANGRHKGGVSRFQGVGFHKGRWRAYIRIAGTQVHLGYFGSEIDAARAYNEAAVATWGDFAKLNDV